MRNANAQGVIAPIIVKNAHNTPVLVNESGTELINHCDPAKLTIPIADEGAEVFKLSSIFFISRDYTTNTNPYLPTKRSVTYQVIDTLNYTQ